MTENKEIYRCNICSNIVEVRYPGTGILVCCGSQMQHLLEKKEGVGPEKHVPIIEKTDHGIKIKIGAQSHPMEKNHLIEWIELIADDQVCCKILKPGDKPEAEFRMNIDSISQIEAREYCNIHGLWKMRKS